MIVSSSLQWNEFEIPLRL